MTQLLVDSVDITAVLAYISERRLVVVSVYILDLYARRTKEENLEKLNSRLEMIKELVQRELIHNSHIEIIVASDFNRHSPL